MRCRCASSRYLGNTSHTTHIAGPGKVHYRHHPLFGQEVEIFRRHRQGAVHGVMVGLADGTRGLIPEWMLDSTICSMVVDQDTPRVAISALCVLRELLDTVGSGSRSASSAQGGSHDAETAKPSSPIDVPMAGRGIDVESAASGKPTRMSEAPIPTASGSRRKAKRKEGGA